MYVDERGEEGAPPVILLHGIGGDHTTWSVVADHLADRYRVYAVDQRGHGSSDRADRYSFRLMAEDVWALADELGLEEVRLVGHSMGGLVALIAAQLRPDRVAGLVVEEAPPPVAMDRPPLDPPDEETPYDFALINQIRAELREPDHANWADLDRLTMPVLVLAGGPTSALPQEPMPDVAQQIPGARLETVAVGHGIHSEAPVEFCRLIDAVLT